MTRRWTLDGRKVLSGTVLLVQLVLGALLPFADARAESAPVRDGVHVEAGSASCPAPHNHRECEFCRHLATNLLAGLGGEAANDGAAHVRSSAVPADTDVPVAAATHTVSARAPPAV